METHPIYSAVFPNTGIADWFLALMGLLLYYLVKLKNVKRENFRWKIWKRENLIPLVISLATIICCLAALPTVFTDYSLLDSLLTGYCSSSLFRTLLKTRQAKFRQL